MGINQEEETEMKCLQLRNFGIFSRNIASIFTYFVEYRVYQGPNGDNIWRVFGHQMTNGFFQNKWKPKYLN